MSQRYACPDCEATWRTSSSAQQCCSYDRLQREFDAMPTLLPDLGIPHMDAAGNATEVTVA